MNIYSWIFIKELSIIARTWKNQNGLQMINEWQNMVYPIQNPKTKKTNKGIDRQIYFLGHTVKQTANGNPLNFFFKFSNFKVYF